MLKYTVFDAESSKLSVLPDLYVGGELHPPTPSMGGAMPPVKAKKARLGGWSKESQPSGDSLIYTLETEPSSEAKQTPLSLWKENRLLCQETANTLQQMSDYDFDSPLHQASDKIINCSLFGAFRNLSDTVANKIGQALCRQRLCPNCQRVLAAKRRASFMQWMELNRLQLEGYKFYHMVLNVRHSVAKKLRDGVYTEELLAMFAALRGSGKTCNRARKAWWEKRISGGVYSVELAPGKTDTSAHIHVHITLFCAPGCIPIYRKGRASEFVKQASEIWRKLTGDPKAKRIFLKPVYYKNEAGEECTYKQGQPTELLYKAVAECMKYTLKSDEASLTGYTPEFLHELLTTRNRYYGRFGVLSKKHPESAQFVELERLNTNFQDLEQVAEKELQSLYNPETGETHPKEETTIALTSFKNTKVRQAAAPTQRPKDVPTGEKLRGGETFYTFRDPLRVSHLPPNAMQEATKAMARTIRAEYQPEYDVPPE